MTKDKIIDYIKKDIRRLDKEKPEALRKVRVHGNVNSVLLDYIVTRKSTLNEILNLMTNNKSPN